MPLVRAYLALGSNLGDRLEQLREALTRLEADDDISLLRSSAVYQNRAVGMGDAEDFLNAVVEVETSLAPERLLDVCLEVESQLGRVRSGTWAPRTIDLDLLVYGDIHLSTERLTLPHPRIVERDFVVKPLADLEPQLILFGQAVQAWLEALPAIELKLFQGSLLECQDDSSNLIC